MSFDFQSAVDWGLLQLDIKASAQQLQQLVGFLELLDQARAKINLVAVSEPAQLISHHLLDSLSLLPFIRGQQVLDLGTGAGFPGLPLACLQVDKHYTLLDSRSRRIEFLTYVCQRMQIDNINLIAQRIEDFQLAKIEETHNAGVKAHAARDLVGQETIKFDTLITRAVASLQDIADLTRHLHNPGLRLIAMKGQRPELEAKQLHIELPHSMRIEPVQIPNLDVQRHLVIIDFKS